MQSYRRPRSFNDFIRLLSALPALSTRNALEDDVSPRRSFLASQCNDIAVYCQDRDQALMILKNIYHPTDLLWFIDRYLQELLQYNDDHEYLAAILQHVAVFAHSEIGAGRLNYHPERPLEDLDQFMDLLAPFIRNIKNTQTLFFVLKKMEYNEVKCREYALIYPATRLDPADIEHDLPNIRKTMSAFINHFRRLILKARIQLIHSFTDLANAVEMVNKHDVSELIKAADLNLAAQDQRWGYRLAILQALQHNALFKPLPKDVLRIIFDSVGLGPDSYVEFHNRFFVERNHSPGTAGAIRVTCNADELALLRKNEMW